MMMNFKRTKAERRPRRIITKDLLKLQDEDDLSPLEMERNFVVRKAQVDDDHIIDGERVTTPETLDSIVMTFSDDDDSFDEDSFDEDDLQFGHGQFEEKWWEDTEITPVAKNNTTTTTTNKMSTMTPFSKLALECSSKRLAFSPLDNKINNRGANASSSPFNFSKHKSFFSQSKEVKNQEVVKSPAVVKSELDLLLKNTKAARQPYVSPFSKNTLARNAEGEHTMPPTYSQPSKEKKTPWVPFTPVKEFNNNKSTGGKTLTTPFSKRKNRRGSPMLSPLDSSAFLTPAKEEDDNSESYNLFDLSLEEEEGVVEIKIRTKSEEENDDHSVISGLTKIEEVDDEVVANSASCDIWGVIVKDVEEEDVFDSGDGLLSHFLHNFMISTPPRKRAITPDEIQL
jgi:hypothetical protein